MSVLRYKVDKPIVLHAFLDQFISDDLGNTSESARNNIRKLIKRRGISNRENYNAMVQFSESFNHWEENEVWQDLFDTGLKGLGEYGAYIDKKKERNKNNIEKLKERGREVEETDKVMFNNTLSALLETEDGLEEVEIPTMYAFNLEHHAIVATIVECKNEVYSVSVCNSGKGLQNHPRCERDGRLFKTIYTIFVGSKALALDAFQKLRYLIWLRRKCRISSFYEYIELIFNPKQYKNFKLVKVGEDDEGDEGDTENEIPYGILSRVETIDGHLYHPGQFAGTCTYNSLIWGYVSFLQSLKDAIRFEHRLRHSILQKLSFTNETHLQALNLKILHMYKDNIKDNSAYNGLYLLNSDYKTNPFIDQIFNLRMLLQSNPKSDLYNFEVSLSVHGNISANEETFSNKFKSFFNYTNFDNIDAFLKVLQEYRTNQVQWMYTTYNDLQSGVNFPSYTIVAGVLIRSLHNQMSNFVRIQLGESLQESKNVTSRYTTLFKILIEYIAASFDLVYLSGKDSHESFSILETTSLYKHNQSVLLQHNNFYEILPDVVLLILKTHNALPDSMQISKCEKHKIDNIHARDIFARQSTWTSHRNHKVWTYVKPYMYLFPDGTSSTDKYPDTPDRKQNPSVSIPTMFFNQNKYHQYMQNKQSTLESQFALCKFEHKDNIHNHLLNFLQENRTGRILFLAMSSLFYLDTRCITRTLYDIYPYDDTYYMKDLPYKNIQGGDRKYIVTHFEREYPSSKDEDEVSYIGQKFDEHSSLPRTVLGIFCEHSF